MADYYPLTLFGSLYCLMYHSFLLKIQYNLMGEEGSYDINERFEINTTEKSQADSESWRFGKEHLTPKLCELPKPNITNLLHIKSPSYSPTNQTGRQTLTQLVHLCNPTGMYTLPTVILYLRSMTHMVNLTPVIYTPNPTVTSKPTGTVHCTFRTNT